MIFHRFAVPEQKIIRMTPISVVIITFNEEKNIRRCIESVQEIADEIVVVDSFSTDNTEAICTELDVKFIKHKFEGHIEQKNWAAAQATNDYVLSLDADEALSEELKENILNLKNQEVWEFEGYEMNRLTSFCGRWIKYSWYPDRKLRLWNKNKGKWGGENPHDKFMMDDNLPVGLLKGDLLHYSFHTISEYNLQIEKFSSIASKAAHAKGKKTSQLGIYGHTISKFLKKYFIQRGFMDGWDGLFIAFASGYATFLKYSKLYMLQHGREK